METLTAAAFDKHRIFWQSRARTRGDGFVGRVKEDHNTQGLKVVSLLRDSLKDYYFEDAMDFGCSYGRMVPTLANNCGHIWTADVLEEMAQRAAAQVCNATAIAISFPITLRVPPLDLLWASLSLQHITDPAMFSATTAELSRVLKSGAKIVILDNAVDKAPHVTPRTPEMFAEALNMKIVLAEKVTINTRPNDHWFIEGIKR